MATQTRTWIAPDIECGGCAASIQKALGRAAGVQGVAVEIESKEVTVEYDSALTNAGQLAETLEEIGFPAEIK